MTFSQSGRRIIPSSFISDGKYNGHVNRLLTIIKVRFENGDPVALLSRNALPHFAEHKPKHIKDNASPITK